MTAQIKLLVDSNAIKTFSGSPSKDSLEYLDIFLLSSFDDSVIVSLGQEEISHKYCKKDFSLGQAGGVKASTPEDGQMLTIYCFNEKLKQTIKLKKGYAYLYVWKTSDKFQIEFTNKIRWLE